MRESDRIGGRSSGHCEPAFIDPFSVSEPEIFSQQGPVHHRNLRIYTLLLMLYEPCSPSSRGINVRVMIPECRPDRRNSSALEPYHVIMTGIKKDRPFPAPLHGNPCYSAEYDLKNLFGPIEPRRDTPQEPIVSDGKPSIRRTRYSARQAPTMISPKNSSCQSVSFPSDIRKRSGI